MGLASHVLAERCEDSAQFYHHQSACLMARWLPLKSSSLTAQVCVLEAPAGKLSIRNLLLHWTSRQQTHPYLTQLLSQLRPRMQRGMT